MRLGKGERANLWALRSGEKNHCTDAYSETREEESTEIHSAEMNLYIDRQAEEERSKHQE